MARGKNDAPVAPIIVKKITIEEGHGHHGGAWKVAYADFVTAMMAFFLLMWLLGATTEKQRKGLADYFTPTMVTLRENSAGSNGLLGGDSIVAADNYPHKAAQTGTRSLTIPRDATGGTKEGNEVRKNLSSGVQDLRQKKFEQLRRRILEAVSSKANLRRLAKQLKMVQTAEGTRIDLVDDADFSMFRLGTTVFEPEAAEIVAILAEMLREEGKELSIRGHTDSLGWKPGAATNNWALSTGRAEATRQLLVREGIDEGSFRRIEGVASREPLIREDAADPRNRRISITMLD